SESRCPIRVRDSVSQSKKRLLPQITLHPRARLIKSGWGLLNVGEPLCHLQQNCIVSQHARYVGGGRQHALSPKHLEVWPAENRRPEQVWDSLLQLFATDQKAKATALSVESGDDVS